MKNYIFAKFSRQNNTAEFSLVELIVTMAIAGIVLTIGGNGLMVILNSDRQAESKTDLRMELNRAIDFIADDLRESKHISTSVPVSWTGWTIPTGYSGLLFLTKSARTPGGSQVAYYSREKLAGATSPVWQGPQIIYRATIANNEGDPLIDSIQTGGFSVPTIAGSRQVTISLTGQSCLQPGSGNICTNPQILTANTQVFARAE